MNSKLENWFEGLTMVPSDGPDNGPEPSVPSKAIITVFYGEGAFLDSYGSALWYWKEMVGEDHHIINDMIPRNTPDGVYVWSGTIRSYRSYEGEYDEELVGDIRPITKEEWLAFRNEEWVFPEDVDALKAHTEWVQKEMEFYNDSK